MPVLEGVFPSIYDSIHIAVRMSWAADSLEEGKGPRVFINGIIRSQYAAVIWRGGKGIHPSSTRDRVRS